MWIFGPGAGRVKTIVTRLGSAHRAVHLTPAERQRRDELRAAQGRRMQAIADALDEHRVTLAAAWIGLDVADLPRSDHWRCLVQARSVWARIGYC
ncbi:hypothetical protein GCM10022419_122150 [Nonomuraea rosea]|uniref:Uncharacterized protein n=1 Tax=Nonomuraea rosea TaxID=638574 RepID=A0ABP6ZPQ7_9ACTN